MASDVTQTAKPLLEEANRAPEFETHGCSPTCRISRHTLDSRVDQNQAFANAGLPQCGCWERAERPQPDSESNRRRIRPTAMLQRRKSCRWRLLPLERLAARSNSSAFRSRPVRVVYLEAEYPSNSESNRRCTAVSDWRITGAEYQPNSEFFEPTAIVGSRLSKLHSPTRGLSLVSGMTPKIGLKGIDSVSYLDLDFQARQQPNSKLLVRLTWSSRVGYVSYVLSTIHRLNQSAFGRSG